MHFFYFLANFPDSYDEGSSEEGAESEDEATDGQQPEQHPPGETIDAANGKPSNQPPLDDSFKVPGSNTPVATAGATQPSSVELPASREMESGGKVAGIGGQKEVESPLPAVRTFVTHEDAKIAFKELLREKVCVCV